MRRQGRAIAATLLTGLVLLPSRVRAQDQKPSAQSGSDQKAPPKTAPAETPKPSTSAEPPPSGPPPQYYVEPQPQTERAAPEPGSAERPPPEGMYEPPPPPVYFEPPPPPMEERPPSHYVPRSAFWAGARVAWVSPFGSLWLDGFDTPNGVYYRRRSFADYASSGPGLELDVGARVGRNYNVFGLWEHSTLGTGSLDPHSFGGQQRGAMNLYGVGVRYSTDPSSVGLAVELALGYRDFRAYWNDGTTLAMTGGWLDARIGIGADIRLSRAFTLSPMFTIAGGSFDHADWSGKSSAGLGFDPLDNTAGYSIVALQLGGHVDIY